METRNALASLARQIEAARILAGFEGRKREFSGVGPAVLRTLRVTYLALSAGLDPWRDASHLFILKVNSRGDHALTQGDLPVPVNAPYLAYLFWTAGVDLLRGQVLFLEPELAKDAVEEALSLLALEQAVLERERLRHVGKVETLRRIEARARLVWDRKIELVAASLLAEEYMERSKALEGPEEAA
jgi:hypothetical protein